MKFIRPHPKDEPLRRFMFILLLVVSLCSGLAFFYKLYEFFHDLTDEDGLRFAGSHLLTYCLVAGGFLLLLTFGFMRGHFADIEKPKYDLLDREVEYDKATNGGV